MRLLRRHEILGRRRRGHPSATGSTTTTVRGSGPTPTTTTSSSRRTSSRGTTGPPSSTRRVTTRSSGTTSSGGTTSSRARGSPIEAIGSPPAPSTSRSRVAIPGSRPGPTRSTSTATSSRTTGRGSRCGRTPTGSATAPANTSTGSCTLPREPDVPLLARPPITGAPLLADCRWKTQRVDVHDNRFSVPSAAIGCKDGCARMAVLSNYGTFPGLVPLQGHPGGAGDHLRPAESLARQHLRRPVDLHAHGRRPSADSGSVAGPAVPAGRRQHVLVLQGRRIGVDRRGDVLDIGRRRGRCHR